MPLRPPAGFISAFYDPLKNPNAPTGLTATGGNTSASIAFTPPTNVGGSAISSYTAISTPEAIIASAASSPISVTGLTNGTAYTFAVWATNTYGPSAFSAASNSVTPSAPRGMFANYAYNWYIAIPTTGNATYFGDLTNTINNGGSLSSSTRGVTAGGDTLTNVIQYITISNTGNATDFGDLTIARYQVTGASNSTRGLFAGGIDASATTSRIDYITIASTGNAVTFGGLADNYGYSNRCGVGGFASTTRAVFGGGTTGGATQIDRTEYATIATTGNTVAFGGLTQALAFLGGASNNTRGIWAGGYDYSIGAMNNIQYVTIATTGNATDFGDLSSTRFDVGGCASSVRAVFSSTGGTVGGMTYITIASTGNSTTFGSLSTVGSGVSGYSNAHGGL